MSKKLLTRTLLNSLGVIAYVLAVAMIMNNGERLFGKEDTILTAVAVLLLFSVSAAVVGSLVFGYPVVLFLGGQKKEGIMAVISTIGWLIAETAVTLVIIASMQ